MDKPTPESGDKATSRKPMGNTIETATGGSGDDNSGYPLRPDTAVSSLLPASQTHSGE